MFPAFCLSLQTMAFILMDDMKLDVLAKLRIELRQLQDMIVDPNNQSMDWKQLNILPNIERLLIVDLNANSNANEKVEYIMLN